MERDIITEKTDSEELGVGLHILQVVQGYKKKKKVISNFKKGL